MVLLVSLSGWSVGVLIGEPFGVSLKVYRERFSLEARSGMGVHLRDYLDFYVQGLGSYNFYMFDNLFFYSGFGPVLGYKRGNLDYGLYIPIGLEGIIRDFPLGVSVELGVNIIDFKPLFSPNLSLKWRDVNVKKVVKVETLYVYKGGALERPVEVKRGNREKAEYYYKLGLNEYSKGNYEKASEYFEMSLKEDPTFDKAKDALERTKRMLNR
ncbi:MAG: tetratricopeptide repeat protein [candidate division WOR-3 bacterium]